MCGRRMVLVPLSEPAYWCRNYHSPVGEPLLVLPLNPSIPRESFSYPYNEADYG